MQRSFSLQITDLEFIESGVEQEITPENAEKIIGSGLLITGFTAYPAEPGDDPPAHKKKKKPTISIADILELIS